MIHAEQIAALEGKFCLTDISLSPAAIESASQAQVVTTDQETGPVTEIRTHSREAHYRMTAVFLSNGADRPNLQWLVDQANREIHGLPNELAELSVFCAKLLCRSGIVRETHDGLFVLTDQTRICPRDETPDQETNP